MRIGDRATVALPKAAVWDVLNDPVGLSRALPDLESIQVVDGDHWRAVVHPATGLGPSRFAMDFEVLERRAGEGWRLSAHAYGSEHVVDLVGEATLTETPDGETTIDWQADVRLGGVLASVGQRVVAELVQRQVGAVLDRLSDNGGGRQT